MAKGKVTIATHSGNAVSMAHNYDKEFRNREEEHVDADKPIQVLHCEDVEQAYEDLFGDAVWEYNAERERKGHPEARIESYLGKVQTEYAKQQAKIDEEMRKGVPEKKRTKPTKCPPVRELIVGVYPQKDSSVSDTENCQMLEEFYERFKLEYPSLHIVGAVIHEDEESIHMHLDYIPVSENNSRGLSVQNSMCGALRDMGFEDELKLGKDGKTQVRKHGDALRKWDRNVNDLLEFVCAERGLSVDHPMRGEDVEHMDTAQYKRVMEQADKKANEIIEQAQKDAEAHFAEARGKVLKEKAEADEELKEAGRLKTEAQADREQARKDRAEAETYLTDAKSLRKEYVTMLRRHNQRVEPDNRFDEMEKRKKEAEEQFE